MYRIVITCDGVLPSCGEDAAREITAHFAEMGAQDLTAKCEWNGKELVLRAESEDDEDGQLTADYFYKLVPTIVRDLGPTGGISIESVEQVEDEGDSSGRTEDEGYEQLADATKLELKGRVQEALLAYQRVADRHSHNAAGHDAKQSIESLRAKIG